MRIVGLSEKDGFAVRHVGGGDKNEAASAWDGIFGAIKGLRQALQPLGRRLRYAV